MTARLVARPTDLAVCKTIGDQAARSAASIRQTRTSAWIAIRRLDSANTNVGVAKRTAGNIDQCDWRSGPGLALSRR